MIILLRTGDVELVIWRAFDRHYSAERLAAADARVGWTEPNLLELPILT